MVMKRLGPKRASSSSNAPTVEAGSAATASDHPSWICAISRRGRREPGLAQMPPFPAQGVANRIGTRAGSLAELPADRRVYLGPVFLLVIAIRVLIEPGRIARAIRLASSEESRSGRRPEWRPVAWHNNPRDRLSGVGCLHRVVGGIERPRSISSDDLWLLDLSPSPRRASG